MTRSCRLTALVALAAMATVFMSACTSASQSPVSDAGSPVAAVAESNAASPSASSSAASTQPTPILDGLLTTASGERVIDDSINEYEARGAEGLQAATRSASNPISNYRTQLLSKGWKLTVDEPTRIAAQLKGDWITLTTTDMESFTGNLPWATVIAYARQADAAADQ
ncbi:MAG TPA: hypothetical protein DDY88_08705 [Actinobacteria bacterium]|nr:hypothetical protein [Actinomycetota bacterium]